MQANSFTVKVLSLCDRFDQISAYSSLEKMTRCNSAMTVPHTVDAPIQCVNCKPVYILLKSLHYAHIVVLP
jgi:hypothetical protein